MRGRTSSIKISLTSEQGEALASLLRRQKTPIGLAKRARAVVLLAEGESFSQISKRVGLGERHLRSLGKTFYRAGSGRLARTSPTGESPGFFPLKWRCIW
jgi:class 3 adenylate cyclase